jgi:hypothetical protein
MCLEKEAKNKFDRPRRLRAGNGPVTFGVQSRIGISKISMVEGVVEFPAELELHLFAQYEVAHES